MDQKLKRDEVTAGGPGEEQGPCGWDQDWLESVVGE